jgi:hypothetical protein
MRAFLTSDTWPRNYHLTFSRSETNARECAEVLELGGNVAVVYSTRKGHALPASYCTMNQGCDHGTERMGYGSCDGHVYPVVDGDVNDVRHTPQGAAPLETRGACVIGLRAKGRAKRDTSGFVVQA